MKYWCLTTGVVVLFMVTTTILAEIDEEYNSSEAGNRYIRGDKSTTCECGWANKDDSRRIVGGVETKENEYPLMAGLIYKPRTILFCGGSVITPYHVVTAAHCTEPFEDRLEDLQVVLGEHDQDKVNKSKNVVYMEVENYIEHEQYRLVGHLNDISIINMKEKIKISVVVGPACLPIQRLDMVGHPVRVLGWGKLAVDGPTSRVLMKVDLDVVELQKCKKHFEYIDLIENNQLCTYHPTKDSCQGDSGGPLLALDREINRYVLVGITSYGNSCAANMPAVSIDVAYYMPWIQKVIASRPGASICHKRD